MPLGLKKKSICILSLNLKFDIQAGCRVLLKRSAKILF
ncbi:Uncharacterized protein dnm_078130 [Desulfonema magnum]|uniref:Uncharacterized protein n=1 Tax=Desulfonema magnum TaxID=45655 RepID=A0A975GS76_9BACT|nr:Uncharacterized protein dnm_078130 [Desulfonema magnum]